MQSVHVASSVGFLPASRELGMQDADAKRPRRDIIELNVGGTHFATGQSTLELSGSVYCKRILDDDGPVPGASYDHHGRLFIDRDADSFKMLLANLRGKNNLPGLTEKERADLAEEALFFDCPRVLRELRMLSDGYKPDQLSPADQVDVCARPQLPAPALLPARLALT